MLDSPIEYLKGVGPQKADLLKKELGIFTFENLLHHFPFRYIDRTKFHKIRDINEEDNQYVQLKGILRTMDFVGTGGKRRLTAILRDETGAIELVWFQGLQWLENLLKIGGEYICYGRPTEFNGKVSITHPEMELFKGEEGAVPAIFQPVYPSTEKLKQRNLDSKGIWNLQKALFHKLTTENNAVPESIPPYILEKFRLPGRLEALIGVHFPKEERQLDASRKRLKFEELFLMQLRILQTKSRNKSGSRGFVFGQIGEFFNDFYHKKLPFPLTNAQKRVIKEIRNDLGAGKQMNRLLQGDVGSGKTIVALLSMLIALDNGFQAAMMAPTEILAQQHFNGISELLEGTGVGVSLLTGSIKGLARKEILRKLADGETHIIIGTHALIQDTVVFKRLGFVIVDEQHRFGVEQRAKLWRKSGEIPPHVLVMTATPIPRTLAMTLYGDLDVSIIDELPPGRTPIKTSHRFESHRLRVFGFMREQIALGRQVYVVYPLIEESETLQDIKDLMAGHEALSREFPQPQFQISIVHGQMKAQDKQFEMDRFAKNITQIMIATTVIEVGVNVPNASIMVIENAERFGLAPLHQLRGRVGRGAAESYCILMTSYKLSADAKARLKTMVETTNGFDIAEADLKLRGPGNIEGLQQSGMLNLKIADLAKDQMILHTARQTAMEVLEKDPMLSHPEHQMLKMLLSQKNSLSGWGRIS